jgi:hypothetical protein
VPRRILFVGDVEAGDHLATLYSLVSTCEVRDIDPVEYLKDVVLADWHVHGFSDGKCAPRASQSGPRQPTSQA